MQITSDEKLWQPTEESIKNTQLYQFIRFVEKKLTQSFKDYEAFYDWSIQDIGAFWDCVWQFCDIQAKISYKTTVILGKTMRDTQWFPEARLNFSENLLKPCLSQKEKIAIIAYNERGLRSEISYQHLYEEVASLADALKKQGVKANDRIAGYLPNIPETIIAMLATASLGAIWSSCSPDFGVQGVIDRFEQIQPKILFATDGQFYNGKTFEQLDKINAIINQVPSIEKVVVIPFISENPSIQHLEKTLLYRDFLTQEKTLTFEYLPFEHPLYILYSSGTTGKPKCIVHSAGGTLIQHLKELVFHTDLSEKDIFLFYTTCGWMMWNWMVSGLATGCTLVLYDGSPTWPTLSTLFDIIEKEKVSVFGTSAKYIGSLQKENLSPKATHNLLALRCILSTGSPLSPDNFDYVYDAIGKNIQLSSISGGTDIVSCFALGNPVLPVYRGQLQCRGLGLAVDIFNDEGQSIRKEKGELVCTKPFPCMPIYFWNDVDQKKYHSAYFERFSNIWAHGDYAEITEQNGVIIYGRSDAVLNPGGVRIGTAEIYRQIEQMDEILDSVVVGQEWNDDVRVILFVKLRPEIALTDLLEKNIRKSIRENASPRHVPAKIFAVSDIPRTLNGKIAELAVKNVIHHLPVKNKEALLNPESLKEYENFPDLYT